MKRFLTVEPIRLLAGTVALTFALLLIGFVAGVATGYLTWQAVASSAIAILIVAGGLLYAWRLGAPGRRR